MTPEEARERNWLRHRLGGAYINILPRHVITTQERELISTVNNIISLLGRDWDKNSIKLGFNLRPNKCAVCGKRSKKEYLMLSKDGIINVCKEHYIEDGSIKKI